jgi:hypothetical protein
VGVTNVSFEDTWCITYHKNGTVRVTIALTINGSFWDIIGIYTFTATASDIIEFTDDGTTERSICTDAIRILSFDETT